MAGYEQEQSMPFQQVESERHAKSESADEAAGENTAVLSDGMLIWGARVGFALIFAWNSYHGMSSYLPALAEQAWWLRALPGLLVGFVFPDLLRLFLRLVEKLLHNFSIKTVLRGLVIVIILYFIALYAVPLAQKLLASLR